MSGEGVTVGGRRASWTVLAAVAAGLTLAACGGGSGSESSTSTTVPTTPPTAPSTAAAPAPSKRQKAAGVERRAAHKERKPLPQPSPREVRKAGHAAGFLVGGGDNSVPTYGSEAVSSVRRLAEGALAGYLSARSREDWASACKFLAASTVGQLERFAKGSGSGPTGCAATLKTLSSTGSASSLADPLTHGLTSLRVKGQSAFALWVGPEKQQYAMPMVREGSGWKLTQIAPLPYPPGSAP